MHLVSVDVQTMAVWCEEGQLWIFEIGRKIIEKLAKINTEDMWYINMSAMTSSGTYIVLRTYSFSYTKILQIKTLLIWWK